MLPELLDAKTLLRILLKCVLKEVSHWVKSESFQKCVLLISVDDLDNVLKGEASRGAL